MHKMTFFPLGNADCCRIDLACGKKLLFDFAATSDPEDRGDLRCDLLKELREDLERCGRDSFDVVAFSHLDQDHFKGAADFFHLEHAAKYQGSDRVKMDIMWVPAALITEENCDLEEARILQREARYRFKQGTGIRVFSRPERLSAWCQQNGVRLDDRRHLITDAGGLVPEFNIAADGAEVFVHSPFAVRQNENDVEMRNEDSLLFHVTFDVEGALTKALLLADGTYESLSLIVSITKAHGREERLEWDIAKLPHHCSYLSVGPDKGQTKTLPTDHVAYLYEKKGQRGAIAISTSKPIPVEGSAEDEDPQPPHRQSANYYKGVVQQLGGQFVATMSHPNVAAPKPLVIEIGRTKGTLKKPTSTAAITATTRNAPRAG